MSGPALLLLAFALCPCPIKRDTTGRILRNYAELYAFKKASGHPTGRPGYVVDHIIPLCACGSDRRENMQWQRSDSARVKDRLEVAACRRATR